MSWTDERIDRLMKMWEGGATASQIAEDLGGVSRNAVIGKAHRLGLKARPSPVRSADKVEVVASTIATQKRARPAVETPLAVEEAELPAAAAVSEPEPVQTGGASTDATPPSSPQSPPVASLSVTPAPATPSADALDERALTATDDEDAVEDGLGDDLNDDEADEDDTDDAVAAVPSIPMPPQPRIVSVGPGGFLRQGPGDQQAPIPPAPPRRLVPAKPNADMADKTGLLDLNERICRWPVGHPGEPDFHFCGDKVNPGFPYCVEHCGRAYQAQLPRGARRPPPPLPFGGPRVR